MKFKRFMALAMAGVMAMGMTVYAAEPIDAVAFTKTVTIAEGITSTEPGAKFTLAQANSFAIEGEESSYTTPEDFTFDPQTYDITDLSSAKKVSDETTVSTDIETAINTFGKPGVYHFTLTETTTPKAQDDLFGWTVVDETVYYIRVYASNGQSGLEYLYGVWEGTANGPDTKVEELAFENEYTKKAGPEDGASFTLNKSVENTEYVPADQTYTFTVTITLPTTADGAAEATISGGETGSDTTITADGDYTVILKDGGSAEFNDLPAGTTVKVVEDTSALINFDTASYEGSDFNGTLSATGDTIDNILIGDTTNEVTCTNTYTSITPTGLAISVAPFVAMFAAVAVAIALYVAAKRRVR